ncbi:hypothetical protein HU200_059255 [Digitaria exilis]|uniref:F-box domain-containing protein n=1 Tax=Digitaria exilis TaxID=1010633 RepID=A0A835AIQ1_9POAL|nr:hypothetical protein HU200_059255 [Digitaria exilis]
MAQLLGASSSKKRRAGGEGDVSEAVAMAAEEEDRISGLPEDLRLRILALLPLKSAIRTGALSTRWRALWERRWPAPSSIDLLFRPGDDTEELLRSLERRGLRRLDRFSLTIERSRNPPEPMFFAPQRFIDYAAACGVENLHVDVANHFMSWTSRFTLPPGCSNLARLFIRHKAGVSFGFSLRFDAFPTLEVIHLHLVRVDINELLWACPRLKTLYLRHCNCEGARAINLMPARAHLKSIESVTVLECSGITHIDARKAHGLRSFRFSSAGFPTYDIAGTAKLDDLYISLRGQNRKPLGHWIRALPDLANVTVLTICSIGLRRVYEMERFGSVANYFYLQLPSSRRDIFVDNSPEEAEEDEPDQVLYEDDASNEEEDVPDEELSEGYETEEELLLEKPPEEYMLKEWLYYKDVYEEDCPEDVPDNEKSEDDVPEDEQSEENVPEDEQFEEDVPLYGLNNLIFAKLMKFKGHYSEMRLVSFLLRRATGLQKLLLVPPPPVGVGNYMEAFGEEPLDTSRFLETILNFEKASPDAQIVLDDSNPPATQPVHSDLDPPPDLPCVEADFLLLNEALANGKLILSESDDITTQSYHSKV